MKLKDQVAIVTGGGGVLGGAIARKLAADGAKLFLFDIRAKYGANIVAIKKGDEIIVSPQADQKISKGDILIVIGSDQDINRLERQILNRD